MLNCPPGRGREFARLAARQGISDWGFKFILDF